MKRVPWATGMRKCGQTCLDTGVDPNKHKIGTILKNGSASVLELRVDVAVVSEVILGDSSDF